MSLPSQLIQSFANINSLPLVSGDITRDNVVAFVNLLNNSIPTQLNPIAYSIYRFNRKRYLTDKTRFISEIKDFEPYNAMILWTDFQDILSFFNLDGKIFLGWDKTKNRYRGFVLDEPPAPIQILRRGETLSNVNQSNTEIIDGDTDADRVFDYMQKRIAEFNAKNKITEE